MVGRAIGLNTLVVVKPQSVCFKTMVVDRLWRMSIVVAKKVEHMPTSGLDLHGDSI